jgi:hypothetical protein
LAQALLWSNRAVEKTRPAGTSSNSCHPGSMADSNRCQSCRPSNLLENAAAARAPKFPAEASH